MHRGLPFDVKIPTEKPLNMAVLSEEQLRNPIVDNKNKTKQKSKEWRKNKKITVSKVKMFANL